MDCGPRDGGKRIKKKRWSAYSVELGTTALYDKRHGRFEKPLNQT